MKPLSSFSPPIYEKCPKKRNDAYWKEYGSKLAIEEAPIGHHCFAIKVRTKGVECCEIPHRPEIILHETLSLSLSRKGMTLRWEISRVIIYIHLYIWLMCLNKVGWSCRFFYSYNKVGEYISFVQSARVNNCVGVGKILLLQWKTFSCFTRSDWMHHLVSLRKGKGRPLSTKTEETNYILTFDVVHFKFFKRAKKRQ